MKTGALTLSILLLQAGVAGAEAPVSSLRPMPRADGAAVTRAPANELIEQIVDETTRPKAPTKVVQAALAGGVARSPRPPARPENLHRRTVVAAAGFRAAPPPVVSGAKGAICGDPAIQGANLSPIAGRISGCGVEAPVRVTSVAGVALSTGATMDCATARALKTWVERGVKPVVGKLGGGVAGLKVAAHYSCRTRNNQKGAKVSEHGRGRAIDIAAIILRNGVAMSVLKGWRSSQHGRLMKAMHRAACGPFGTVLGPNADRFHQDHFHLDTARYRRGSYCR
nr:extensin family protein [Oceaniglobus trochenteri]